MSNWIGTNTGRKIDLSNPDPNQIDIFDIATGLANVCRFGGQLCNWYSVAEHSMHVAELVPPADRLVALLHDASEAYICDIPTPLKRELGQFYTDIEDRVTRAIDQKFALGGRLIELPDTVKVADRMMVVSERDGLQSLPQNWGPDYESSLRYPMFERQFSNPDSAHSAFMKMFRQLSEMTNG